MGRAGSGGRWRRWALAALLGGASFPAPGAPAAPPAPHRTPTLGFEELPDNPPPPAVRAQAAPEPGTPASADSGKTVPSAYGAASAVAPDAGAPSPSGADIKVLSINLPMGLQLANAGNPTIALARARVEEAYVRLQQAQVLWVPNIVAGPAYMRHDGYIQNALGLVFHTNKDSLFVGGGAVASWQTSDALFGPLIARQLVRAQAAASRATTDDVQLDVALTYLDLLRTYGALAINAESLAKAREMLRVAEQAERAGLGKTTADPNRARTEVEIRRQEQIDLEGEAGAVSARLAQLLQMEPTADLRPIDPAILPITLVPENGPIQELVVAGLMNRPELAESRALVVAAVARWRQARVGPLLPRIDLSYTGGAFGGGFNDNLDHWGGRADGAAQVTWELHNFGLGDVYETRARQAQLSQANFHVAEVEARVGAEVTAAVKVARSRQRSLGDAQEGVRQAEEMWRRLERAVFGVGGAARQFDPLEPLLAEQALHQARMQYLTEVIEYDKAQFRLYWAMGQPPLCALPQAAALPVEVPVRPTPGATGAAPQKPAVGVEETLPLPQRVPGEKPEGPRK